MMDTIRSMHGAELEKAALGYSWQDPQPCKKDLRPCARTLPSKDRGLPSLLEEEKNKSWINTTVGQGKGDEGGGHEAVPSMPWLG